MNKARVIEKINKDRHKVEACFVFALWKDPELYADYMQIGEGTDETLKNEDAQFYFNLGKAMVNQGYRTFDGITLNTFLSTRSEVSEHFEELGGMREVEQLKSLVSTDNVEAYYDQICKMNSLTIFAEKYNDMMVHIERFDDATTEDVFNAFDLLNTSIAVNSDRDARIEDLTLDDEFLKNCKDGMARGLDYSAYCPIMNYITLGIPLGELTMIAGYSGVGKSSFIFENIVLPLNAQGIKVAIISNEMRAEAYKNLLLSHILTKDLNYWDLTRKKIKMGGFSDEQWEMVQEAQKISREKYKDIRFIKMFDNENSKVLKHVRKLAHQGYQAVIYDTLKSDDVVDENMWIQLCINARKLFQVASKNNIAIVSTYQLALHTLNQRYLNTACLSNSKQITEVFSEMVMFRRLWSDELTGEKHDCKPYRIKKRDGTSVREPIELNPEKNYLVAFIAKTRNDETGQQILYEFNSRFNLWKEIGKCTVIDTHMGA